MTPDYRDNLVHLMTMQADSELSGGYGYVPWITKAPTVEEKHVVAQIVKDELRHAAVMYGLLADLGFDVDSHVRRHDETLTMRIDADADIGTKRITEDKRVNIFYYPIDTWADFIFFNFCMDRGAGHQLEDVRHCSYGPWVRAIEGGLSLRAAAAAFSVSPATAHRWWHRWLAGERRREALFDRSSRPLRSPLRETLRAADTSRNIAGEKRPPPLGGMLPISFCGGPDRIVEQVRRCRAAIGAGVLDLSLSDPGTGDVEGMMRSLELFGTKVLPRIREI